MGTAPDITGYIVYYRPDSDGEELSITFPGSTSSGSISGLTPDVSYTFQVAAIATVDGNVIQGERSVGNAVEAVSDNSLESRATIFYAVGGTFLSTAVLYTAVLLLIIFACCLARKQRKHTSKNTELSTDPEYMDMYTEVNQQSRLNNSREEVDMQNNTAYVGVSNTKFEDIDMQGNTAYAEVQPVGHNAASFYELDD